MEARNGSAIISGSGGHSIFVEHSSFVWKIRRISFRRIQEQPTGLGKSSLFSKFSVVCNQDWLRMTP